MICIPPFIFFSTSHIHIYHVLEQYFQLPITVLKLCCWCSLPARNSLRGSLQIQLRTKPISAATFLKPSLLNLTTIISCWRIHSRNFSQDLGKPWFSYFHTVQKGGQSAVVLERAEHTNAPTSSRSRDTASSSNMIVPSSLSRCSTTVFTPRCLWILQTIADQDDHI
jgi:hypothetical protein